MKHYILLLVLFLIFWSKSFAQSCDEAYSVSEILVFKENKDDTECQEGSVLEYTLSNVYVKPFGANEQERVEISHLGNFVGNHKFNNDLEFIFHFDNPYIIGQGETLEFIFVFSYEISCKDDWGNKDYTLYEANFSDGLINCYENTSTCESYFNIITVQNKVFYQEEVNPTYGINYSFHEVRDIEVSLYKKGTTTWEKVYNPSGATPYYSNNTSSRIVTLNYSNLSTGEYHLELEGEYKCGINQGSSFSKKYYFKVGSTEEWSDQSESYAMSVQEEKYLCYTKKLTVTFGLPANDVNHLEYVWTLFDGTVLGVGKEFIPASNNAYFLRLRTKSTRRLLVYPIKYFPNIKAYKGNPGITITYPTSLITLFNEEEPKYQGDIVSITGRLNAFLTTANSSYWVNSSGQTASQSPSFSYETRESGIYTFKVSSTDPICGDNYSDEQDIRVMSYSSIPSSIRYEYDKFSITYLDCDNILLKANTSSIDDNLEHVWYRSNTVFVSSGSELVVKRGNGMDGQYTLKLRSKHTGRLIGGTGSQTESIYFNSPITDFHMPESSLSLYAGQGENYIELPIPTDYESSSTRNYKWESTNGSVNIVGGNRIYTDELTAGYSYDLTYSEGPHDNCLQIEKDIEFTFLEAVDLITVEVLVSGEDNSNTYYVKNVSHGGYTEYNYRTRLFEWYINDYSQENILFDETVHLFSPDAGLHTHKINLNAGDVLYLRTYYAGEGGHEYFTEKIVYTNDGNNF